MQTGGHCCNRIIAQVKLGKMRELLGERVGQWHGDCVCSEIEMDQPRHAGDAHRARFQPISGHAELAEVDECLQTCGEIRELIAVEEQNEERPQAGEFRRDARELVLGEIERLRGEVKCMELSVEKAALGKWGGDAL